MSIHSTHIHALIVAAGKGTRFGLALPKQYLTIAGQPILVHSIACLNIEQITDLTLVVSGDDTMARQLDFVFDKPVYFAVGGAERFLSVRSGLSAIRQRGATDDDWVLIHDAVRPCLPKSDLLNLLATITKLGDEVGVILATPVADTLKFAQNHTIVKTINREQLWQAQTPQIFRLGALECMLDHVIGQGLVITDEASGFELMGQTVRLVAGSRTNMKLTYPDDLPLFERLLGQM